MNAVELSYRFSHNFDALVKYCMEVGLIAKKRICRVCGMEMLLSKKGKDGLIWKCSKGSKNDAHLIVMSIRKHSWFQESKLSMFKILYITYLWCNKVPSFYMLQETKCSPETLADWKSYCREICVDFCLGRSEKIGGPGHVVEVDESMFGLRSYKRGKNVNGNWVYGGIDMESKKCFFEVVPERSSDALFNILKEFVFEGTTIFSDCWKAYSMITDVDFAALTESHGLNFKDYDHCYSKRSWSAKKHSIMDCNYIKDQIHSYFAEYICRKILDDNEFFEKFLEQIKIVFDPRGPEDSETDTAEEGEESNVI